MADQAPQSTANWRHRHPALPAIAAALILGALVLVAVLGRDVVWDLIARYKAMPAMQVPLGLLIAAICLYALLIAVPFMPGIEVGLALLMLQGAAIAPAVYLATVAGLTLAYALGCLVPQARLARVFHSLRLRRASRWIAEQEGTTPAQKLAHLQARMPLWLLRYRYVWLALLINLPGNSLLGGGGGVCLLAGLSRVFHPRAMLLTVTLAVAPVPFLVWIAGAEVLDTIPLP